MVAKALFRLKAKVYTLPCGNENGIQDIGNASHPNGLRLSYTAYPSDLKKVPGYAIAYWLNRFDIFSKANVGKSWISGGRIKTHDGSRYIRYHWEIAPTSDHWCPLIKGGAFRKYYGNEDHVVDWSAEAVAFYDSHGGLRPRRFDDKEGICWSKITSTSVGFRIKPPHVEYDSASPTIFNESFKCDPAVLGFLNSVVCHWILDATNPTLNLQLADVLALPLILPTHQILPKLSQNTVSCIEISRIDWDNFETLVGLPRPAVAAAGAEGRNAGSKLAELGGALHRRHPPDAGTGNREQPALDRRLRPARRTHARSPRKRRSPSPDPTSAKTSPPSSPTPSAA